MTDREIFNGIVQKDNRSFIYLRKECLQGVVRMVKSNSGNEQDALDVLQEGLVAVWINITKDKYALQKDAKITTYIHQICRNIWISKLRKNKNTTDLSSLENTLTNDETDHFENDEIKTLQGLLDKLNQTCKNILNLFYFQKLALKEIAAKLNLTEKTAKNNKYRCMQKLRSIYESHNAKS